MYLITLKKSLYHQRRRFRAIYARTCFQDEHRGEMDAPHLFLGEIHALVGEDVEPTNLPEGHSLRIPMTNVLALEAWSDEEE